MNKVKIVKGDATNPVVEDGTVAFIPHVCNINGGWGSGFVLALSKKWKEPEKEYRKWFKGKKVNKFDMSVDKFVLGAIDPIPVEENIVVINMLAQEGFYDFLLNSIPLNYTALVNCMRSVADFAKRNFKKVSVHAPFFGCDRAKGNKEVILKLIDEIWIRAGIPVTMYEWEENKSTSISTEIKFIEK